MGAPDHGAGRAATRPHRMGIPFRVCIKSSCLRCGHLLPPSRPSSCAINQPKLREGPFPSGFESRVFIEN
jgi:hypothetical protein